LSAGYSGRFGSGVISEERPHFGRRNDGGQHGREGNAVSYLGQSSCAENFNSGKSKARRTSKDYPPDPFHFVITAIALESIPLKTRVQTFNFIRRAQVAFDEYVLAGGVYRRFFTDRNPVFVKVIDVSAHRSIPSASAAASRHRIL
jgi:hypothetical protein